MTIYKKWPGIEICAQRKISNKEYKKIFTMR